MILPCRNFRIKCADDLALDCHAYQLLRSKAPAPAITPGTAASLTGTAQLTPSSAGAGTGPATLLTYGAREDKSLGLFAWVRNVIEDTLTSS